jgi:flagellar biosynthesis/type III secretory pathway M-ring protein FliF/YscJ
VGSIDEAKVYAVTVEYTFQGKKESVKVTVSAQPEKEKGPIPWVTVIIVTVVVLAVLGAAIFVFLIARKRSGKKPAKETKEPAPQVTVQAVREEPVGKKVPQTENVEEAQTFEAVRTVEPPSTVKTPAPPPEDEEHMADSVMNEILGGEPPVEVAEVVEAELLER